MKKEELVKRKLEIRTMLEGEGEVNLDELEQELRSINEQLQAIEKREHLMSEAAAITSGGAEQTRTVHTFNNGTETRSLGADDVEYRNAFMNYVLRGEELPVEMRANALTKTTDIGAVIPQTVLNRIVEKIEASGMILPLVTRTAIKGGVTVPTSSVKPVATWVAEGATSDKQKKTTGTITFNYNKLRCAVAVSLEVDTMALPIFEQTLINNIVEAMTMAIEQSIVSGDGIGKPKGILAETPIPGQQIDTAKLDYKTLVNAEAALPIEYENGAVWTMTKKTFMGFTGMVDSAGQPIARVNYGVSGKPERILLGRPVVLCNYIGSFDSVAVGQPIAFLFDYKDYVLNTNYQMGVKKYEDNETDDQVTKAIMVVDGKVVDKGSLVILKKVAAV